MKQSKIKHIYKNIDVVCGHCKKRTRTLSAVMLHERYFFGCKECTYELLNDLKNRYK